MPDDLDARGFLAALFGDPPPQGTRVALWTKHNKRSTYLEHYAGLPAIILSGERSSDVYTCVSLAGHAYPHNRRHPQEEAAGIVGFWLDVDVNGGPTEKKNAAPDKPTALALTHQVAEPSITVDSGYGVQAWWLFDEPWLFAAGEWDEAWGHAATWIDEHASRVDYALDRVQDLARLMRVPGTSNAKGSTTVPVRVLSAPLTRYPRNDLIARCSSRPRPRSTRKPAGQLELDSIDPSTAQLPLAKFEGLLELNIDFRRTWKHARPGPAWSPSQCEQALTNHAVNAGWEDQEIAALIREHRRQHTGSNPDKWQRADYVAGTIANARRARIVEQREEKREEALGELERLSDTTVNGNRHDADRRVDLFNIVVAAGREGAPRFRELVQHGRDWRSASLALVSESGQRVELGTVRHLLDQTSFQAAVCAATGHVTSRVKAQRWEAAVQALMSVASVTEGPEDTPAGRVVEWLRQYLDRDLEADEQGVDDAVRERRPFSRDDDVYVCAASLAGWVRLRRADAQLRSNEIPGMLRAAGFERVAVNYSRKDGRRSTASYWRADRSIVE